MNASCQCGQLTADISDPADMAVVMCHCTDCQRRSGSPFGAIAYFPEAAVSLHGESREFTRPADSGQSFTTGFCPQCGSTVYARAAIRPGIVGITLGAFADPQLPAPARSVYEQSRFAWIAIPEGTIRHTRGRDS